MHPGERNATRKARHRQRTTALAKCDRLARGRRISGCLPILLKSGKACSGGPGIDCRADSTSCLRVPYAGRPEPARIVSRRSADWSNSFRGFNRYGFELHRLDELAKLVAEMDLLAEPAKLLDEMEALLDRAKSLAPVTRE